MIARILSLLFGLVLGASCLSNPTPHPAHRPTPNAADPSHSGTVVDPSDRSNGDGDADPAETPTGTDNCTDGKFSAADATSGDDADAVGGAGTPPVADAVEATCDGGPSADADSGPDAPVPAAPSAELGQQHDP